MAKSGRNTASKLPKKSKGKPRGKGRPFEKDDPVTGKKDTRRNLKGRPKTSDELKKFVVGIFEEEGVNQITGQKISILRQMVLKMALDGTPADRIHLLDRGFGKVPDEVIVSYDDLQKIIDYLPQDMLERLAKGEPLGDVIISLVKARGDGQDSDSEK